MILQKIPGSDAVKADWDGRVEAYAAAEPSARIVGLPERVKRVTNRGTMLDVVASIGIDNVSTPRQIVLSRGMDAGAEIRRAGMKPPYLAKALICDGSAHSHRVAIIHDEGGVETLYKGEVSGIELPCVLQEYVNHGGCLFKVYVVGTSVTSATRRSLPDLRLITEVPPTVGHDYGDEGAVIVPRVSRFVHGASAPLVDSQENVIHPPDECVLREIGLSLHQKLGLDLFNFDLIRDKENPEVLLIVDINYLPGISKMPGYLDAFTNYFLAKVDG